MSNKYLSFASGSLRLYTAVSSYLGATGANRLLALDAGGEIPLTLVNRIAHSALSGLTGDDHTQYVHTSIARTITAAHTISNTTPTTSSTTGALVISGGLGVGERIFSAGRITTNVGVFIQSTGGLTIKNSTTSSGYGVIFRNDGSSFLLLLTNQNDADGAWNSFRPLRINLLDGTVRTSSIVESDNTTASTSSTTGALVVTGGVGVGGAINGGSTITGTRLISNIATGTAPLTVTSTTVCTNLNADLLDGQHGSYYAPATKAFVDYESTRTDITGLTGGSVAGVIYEGNLNSHVVIGVRGNDSDDGFHIIDTNNTGGGSYVNSVLKVTSQTIQHMGVELNLRKTSAIELGTDLTGNRNCLIDFHGDDTYTDYGLRVIRGAGADGASSLVHRGTGLFRIDCVEGANVEFVRTNSRVSILGTTASTSSSSGALVVSGGVGVGGAINVGTDVTVGDNLTVSGTGTTSTPNINLNNGTTNWINFATAGVAAPTFNTRSAGTKICLYPNIGAATTDYAIGIEGSTLWQSVNTTASFFKWYGGTTLAGELSGAGLLELRRGLTVHGSGVGGAIKVKNASEIGSTSGYAVMHYIDSTNYYILLTNNNDAEGTFNSFRPLYIDLATGLVSMNQGLDINATTASTSTTTGAITVAGGIGVAGAITGGNTITGTRLISNIATGTAPLSVSSTTVCTNLNADLLDGQQGSFYLDTSSTTQSKSGILNLTATTSSTSTTTGALVVTGGVGVGGTVNAANVTAVGGLRACSGSNAIRLTDTGSIGSTTGYGVIHHFNGADYYILLTNNNDALGSWNSLRPFTVNVATGNVSMAHTVTVGTLAGTGNRAVYSTSTGALTNSSSDRTLKKNVTDLNYGLEEVLKLNPVSYQWKDESKLGSQVEIGLIAQEVQEVIPEVVGENSDGTLSIDYPKLVAVLINAIKELKNAQSNG